MKKKLLFLKRALLFIMLMSISIALFYLKELSDWYIVLADINLILCLAILLFKIDSFKKSNGFRLTVPFFMSLILWFDSAGQNILFALAIIPIAFISLITYLYFGLRIYFREEQSMLDTRGY